MAVAATYLKRTNQEVLVRVGGTAAGGTGSTTINLTTDMIGSCPQTTDGATQTVNIIGFGWSGLPSSTVTVLRGTVNVFTLDSSGAGYMDFDGQEISKETTGNTSPITVTTAGAEAQVWLKLRKEGGYKGYIETSTYGAYDDETKVGAKTNVPGSPDYTP